MEQMKKFDLRLKQETVEAIQELADKKYYGNRSLCARDLLERAIEIDWSNEELKEAIEILKEINKKP